VVQQRVGSDTPARDMGASGYLLLQDPKGVKLAGNLNTMQPRLGIFSQRALRGHDELLGKGVQLDDGSFLFVGRDTPHHTRDSDTSAGKHRSGDGGGDISRGAGWRSIKRTIHQAYRRHYKDMWLHHGWSPG
jgi:hypothetical protein